MPENLSSHGSADRNLQQAVLAELAWEPSILAAHIGVAARDGVVTLSGHVDSFVQKHAAEDAVRRVHGVKGVAEELDVRLAFDMQRGDDDIAAAAMNRLAWDAALPRDAIRAKVEQGWVVLNGQVEWQFQKEAAAAAVRQLSGVVGVSNEITIRPGLDAGEMPSANSGNISDDIMHALHRSWFFDPQTVVVSAEGGQIRLSGTVTSWHERAVAAETAWAAKGATDVQNDIVVV